MTTYQDNAVDASGHFRLGAYIIINVAVWLLLAAGCLLAGWLIGDWHGLPMIFLLLALAFTAASVFDALCESRQTADEARARHDSQ